MSIQWRFIAGCLYLQLAIVIVMMLPLFSPRKWNRLFKSRLFSKVRKHGAIYFYVWLGVLSLFLLDAIREIKKYSYGTDGSHAHITAEMKVSVKLFRAQRNFYITGFSIFLAFVQRRLATMLIIQDELSIKAERIIREAKATVKLAKKTVLNNNLKANDAKNVIASHKKTEELLETEQNRVKQLEEEVTEWKTKYLEAVAGQNEKGD